MTNILEKAKQHFRDVINGEGLRYIEIAEWGEVNQPVKIYFKPLAALPVKIYSKFIELGTQQTVEAFVDMLILRCLDQEGKPLFKPVDRTEMLRQISPVVVCDIIRKMSDKEKDDHIDAEIAEKNS